MRNSLNIDGRLTEDVKLQDTNSGGKMGMFSIACQRDFKNKEGNYDADFFNVICFNNTAKLTAEHFHKGSPIGIEGKLQNYHHPENDGHMQYNEQIIMQKIDWPLGKNEGNNQPSKSKHDFRGTPNKKNDPFKKQSTGVHVGEDDVPF